MYTYIYIFTVRTYEFSLHLIHVYIKIMCIFGQTILTTHLEAGTIHLSSEKWAPGCLRIYIIQEHKGLYYPNRIGIIRKHHKDPDSMESTLR